MAIFQSTFFCCAKISFKKKAYEGLFRVEDSMQFTDMCVDVCECVCASHDPHFLEGN